MKIDPSPLPCTCGTEPQVLVDSRWRVFVHCPNCSLRSAYVEADSIAHPRTAVKLNAFLEALSENAVMAWNSMIKTGTRYPGKQVDGAGPACGQCSSFIGMGDWNLSCIKRSGIVHADTDASYCNDFSWRKPLNTGDDF